MLDIVNKYTYNTEMVKSVKETMRKEIKELEGMKKRERTESGAGCVCVCQLSVVSCLVI